jgi:chromate reductase, NAD(P)H dehydrogenase (quinone)
VAKIILMAMSLRKESFNKKLAQNIHRILKAQNQAQEIELLSFNDYPLPVYNADDEASQGIPEKVQALATKIRNCDGWIISTPEYNGSIPGPFKNALDWVSRAAPIPWGGKQILLTGASPGALGAIRSLWHSRHPFEATGGFVYPDMMGLSKAHEAFDDQGVLKDKKFEENLTKLLLKFLEHVNKNA